MPLGIFLRKTGSPKILKVEEFPTKQIQGNEIKIKIHYAGINYADILARKGIYQWTPKRPYILGFEASGEIIELGEKIDNRKFVLGHQVIVIGQHGCYATEVVKQSNQVFPIVPQLSMKENAGYLATWVTAYIALIRLGRQNITKNSTVLINSAAGGVGTSAVKIAKTLGAYVIGTVGNDTKKEFLYQLGVDKVINYNKESILSELGDKSVDFCLESVGGDVFRESFNTLKPLGMLLSIGLSNIDFSLWRPLTWYKTWKTLPKVNIVKMIGQNQIVGGLHIGRLMDSGHELPWKELTTFIIENNLKPVIGKIFPLKEANLAHKYLESRKSMGKILLKCKE